MDRSLYYTIYVLYRSLYRTILMEKLRYVLSEWFEGELPELVPRELPLGWRNTGLIVTLAGVRRGGKTYLLYQMIGHLREEEPRENIIYVNFEDDRLYPIEGNEVSELLDTFLRNFSYEADRPLYLFLDEVQNIPNWEATVRRLHDRNRNLRMFLTGSSSKLLSSEVASSLRGRTLSHIVYPLSFKEFLKFKGFELGEVDGLPYSPRRNELIRLFNEYLEFGGFPQVVLEEQKAEILREYYRAIFYRDIVERYEVRNVRLFENFLKLLVQNMGDRFSYGKVQRFLRSIGFPVSKNTLMEYMGMAKSAFMCDEVPIFSRSVKDQMQYPRKVYIIDNGLRNAVCFRSSRDLGKLLENVVFWELRRRSKEVYYWTSRNGYEVDFVVWSGGRVEALYQVCYELHDERTRKREMRASVRAMEEFGLGEATVLTYDQFGGEEAGGRRIRFLPVWFWSLTDGRARQGAS